MNSEEHREYSRRHYQKNKQYYIEKSKKARLKNRESNQEYLIEYLLSHPCVDCGEKDILVLEFDHVNGKNFSINAYLSLTRIKTELTLCEVRCANCHTRRHAIENNSWKLGGVAKRQTQQA